MNPALGDGRQGGMVGSQMARGPRDRLIGQTITVGQGSYKGYKGIVKDTNGNMARVELNTGNKLVMIDKNNLRWLT